ncbi:hypothetical protein RclHR1_05660004 [Rhizophagus clarus]|uniref:Attractin/MKLN-like beta-propeller domain-containing protein n=1 Tax=Rhizophagus clarus TaxID=94130 RepID=A0A2Z6SGD8_9GLOM|nr:hypothetical protein RclHR1_05660004 [Rhizophagus clarus]GES88012.1 hypothetical protein GLOIN_2v1641931 [Rhizophagus clarus]
MIKSVNSQSLSPRYGHSSTYIYSANSTLYILGGIIDNALTNEFISIDVSPSSLSSQQTKITYMNKKTNMDFILPHAFAQTSSGLSAPFQIGSNLQKTMLFLFGGLQNNLFEFDLSRVFAFNTSANQWVRPNIDKYPPQKHFSFRVIDSNYTESSDSIYTFSIKDNNGEVDLLYTGTLNWNFVLTLLQFGNLHGFTATLLRNGIIVYFGGSIISDGNNQGFGDELFSRNHQFAQTTNLTTYDTKTNVWGIQQTIGDPPEGRTMHSAIVTLDGRVIIYGGINNVMLGEAISDPVSKKYPDPLISILETFSQPFHWTTLQLGDNSLEPLQSYGHTATLVGNYMIVAFGMQSSENANPKTTSSLKNSFTPSDSIYMMDTTNKTHIIWSKLQYTLIDFPIHPKLFTQAQQGGIIFGSTMLGTIVGIVVGNVLTNYLAKKYPIAKEAHGAAAPESD